MSDQTTSMEPEIDPLHDAVPKSRLSVFHLMLWTLCSALYLTFLRAIYAQQGDIGQSATLQQTSGLIHSIIVGATITGAIVLVSIRIAAGPPLLRQPGHWLLLVAAIMALITPIVIFLLLFMQDTGNWVIAVFGVFYLLPSFGFAIAAYRTRGLLWKFLFVGLVSLALAQALFYFGFGLFPGRFGSWFATLSVLPMWGNPVLGLAMMFVAVGELKTGPRRDWLHWTGVTTHLASSIANMLWMFA